MSENIELKKDLPFTSQALRCFVTVFGFRNLHMLQVDTRLTSPIKYESKLRTIRTIVYLSLARNLGTDSASEPILSEAVSPDFVLVKALANVLDAYAIGSGDMSATCHDSDLP